MKISIPFKDVLPPLSCEELEALRSSILSDGVVYSPIIVTPDGEILDGHNRYELCGIEEGTGIHATVKVLERAKNWTDAQKRAYVIRTNIGRRNLNDAQRKRVMNMQKELAIQLSKEGRTQRDISTKVGVAQGTVSKWLVTTNIPRNNGGTDQRRKFTEEEVAAVVDRVLAGETQKEVAKATGLSQQRISKAVKKRREALESAEEEAEQAPATSPEPQPYKQPREEPEKPDAQACALPSGKRAAAAVGKEICNQVRAYLKSKPQPEDVQIVLESLESAMQQVERFMSA